MIDPAITVLTGRWITADGKVTGDAVCEQIRKLTKSYLVRIDATNDGWHTLYRDPADGALWEHSYPQSHMHGGGPPQLSRLSADEAKQKFDYPPSGA